MDWPLIIQAINLNKPNSLGLFHLSLKFLHPGLCSLECVGVGDIIDDDGGLRSPVVHGGEAVVPLLARRVPDLKLGNSDDLTENPDESYLNRRVIQTNCLGQKCCSDGGLKYFLLQNPISYNIFSPPGIHETVP